MSADQNKKAARFRALHDGAEAFVIPNPWDVGSARNHIGFYRIDNANYELHRRVRFGLTALNNLFKDVLIRISIDPIPNFL